MIEKFSMRNIIKNAYYLFFLSILQFLGGINDMAGKTKFFIKIIIAIIALIGALIFVSSVRSEALEFEKDLNGTYYEYNSSPDDFAVTEAKIIEEFDFDSGDRLHFGSLTNQWMISVNINNAEIQTTVMRDAEHDSVDDVIKIAYKKLPLEEYSSSNLLATRLEYIEDTPARNSCTAATVVCSAVLLAYIAYIVISTIKSR